jgi:mutator protein MutT
MKRIATIIIRNEKGDFFVHQRSEEKKTFPSLFGLGAGGHIEGGETPEEGAARELFEETGLSEKPVFLFNFDFESSSDSYPVYVFLVNASEEPNFEEREWQWSGWMSRDEVDQLLQEEKLCPDTAIFYKKYCTDYLDAVSDFSKK